MDTDKSIIIDGYNVAECEFLLSNYECMSNYNCDCGEITQFDKCKDCPNCYYKQLQRAKAELEQYKKSKQASYESMQAEWNNAVNELRDIKAENEKMKENLSEAEAIMLTYKIERDNYKEALIDIRVRFINKVAWVGGMSKFENEIFNKICEVLDNER